VDDAEFPAGFLRDASLTVVPGLITAREAWACPVDWQGTCGVLRGRSVPADSTVRADLMDDVRWLHEFLARLAALGFPSPPAAAVAPWWADCISARYGRVEARHLCDGLAYALNGKLVRVFESRHKRELATVCSCHRRIRRRRAATPGLAMTSR